MIPKTLEKVVADDYNEQVKPACQTTSDKTFVQWICENRTTDSWNLSTPAWALLIPAKDTKSGTDEMIKWLLDMAELTEWTKKAQAAAKENQNLGYDK